MNLISNVCFLGCDAFDGFGCITTIKSVVVQTYCCECFSPLPLCIYIRYKSKKQYLHAMHEQVDVRSHGILIARRIMTYRLNKQGFLNGINEKIVFRDKQHVSLYMHSTIYVNQFWSLFM